MWLRFSDAGSIPAASTKEIRMGNFFLLLILISSAFSQEVYIQIFGDVRASYSSQNKRADFVLGDADLLAFLTHGRLKGLLEVYLEQPEGKVDLERGYVEVSLGGLYIKLGKFHSPIGYFNQKWHHGLYLMTPVDRPLVVSFEDEGGPLPVHMVGVEAGLETEVFGKRAGLKGSIGNGNLQLGSENTQDFDPKKSLLGKAYLLWDPFSEIGLSFGYDPMEVSDPDVGYVKTENYIFGLHLARRKPGSLEVNGEVYILRERLSGKSGTGGFFLISYPVHRGGFSG
ncbi:MAG: hypothetical protein Q9N34_05415 [Aquificota bacterium]|nr:hypothetical protein [Aquificota bacterium]